MAPFRPSLQQLRILIGLWKDITPFWTIWETYSPPQTVTYDFYCTEAKHNKSTNNPWYLIIQVTHVYNCLETCRKTLKRCWFFFFGWLVGLFLMVTNELWVSGCMLWLSAEAEMKCWVWAISDRFRLVQRSLPRACLWEGSPSLYVSIAQNGLGDAVRQCLCWEEGFLHHAVIPRSS